MLDRLCEGHIRDLLIIVSTANVGVDAGEPALIEVSKDIFRRVLQYGGKGPVVLVEGKHAEGILNTRGEVGVVEAVLFLLVPSDPVPDDGIPD